MLTFQYLAKFQKMLGYSMKGGHGTDRCWGYSRNTVYSHPWGPLESLECCIIHLTSYVHETELIRNDAI